MRRAPRFATATLAGLVLVGLGVAGPLRPATPQPTLQLLDTAVIRSPWLRESSGVVASRRHPGVYWSHNDSGDGPVLYATDSAGTDRGGVRLLGARAVDWEDIAYGPCVVQAGHCLYIADTGDNATRRSQVVIYRLPEPRLPAGPGDTAATAAVLDSIVLRYPDRPRDAEGLGITPDGWLLLVTKDRTRTPRLFRARVPGSVREPVLLEDRGELPITFSWLRGRMATGADVSPSGYFFVVRTYVSVHLFRLAAGEVAPLTDPNGLPIPVLEDQGEGIAFDGESRLVLTSERAARNHAIIQRLTLGGTTP